MSEPAAPAPVTKRPPRHLWDYWRIIWEGRRILLTVLSITLLVAIVGTLLMPKRYKAEAIAEITLTQQVVLGAITERSASRSFFDTDREFKTEFVKIRTRAMMQRAIDDYQLREKVPGLARVKQPVEVLRRCLLIERVGQTNVASIGVSWDDPAQAAIIANAIAETYVKSDLAEREAYYDSRLARLKGSLGEKSAARRAIIERELAVMRSDRALDELLNLSTLEESERLKLLWEDLKTARSDLASVRTTAGPAHPDYQAAAGKVAEVERQIKGAMAAAVTDLEGELRALGGDPQKIDPSAATLTSMQQQSDLDFEKDLQTRVTEFELLKRLADSRARIIDEAQPPLRPFSPKWSLNLMLALVVGLGFGGGLIFFKDFLDTSVKTIDDVERELGLPLLAVVPAHAEGGALDKVAAESFQTLRTGLLFASGGRKDKILLVTSSAPQEGKTSVVVSLAKAVAASGERVLLIDADLRRASLSKVLGGRRDKGLSSYLADAGSGPWRDLLSPVEKNLDLLASGPLPPHPVDLLATAKFRDLLQEGKSSHAWVIIDSPPVSSVSDPVLLASMSEMVLIVLRHDRTDRDVARRALARLAGVGARTVGAVLNGVDMEKAYNREYYYGRFFYGQDYGNEAQGPQATPPHGALALLRKFLK